MKNFKPIHLFFVLILFQPVAWAQNPTTRQEEMYLRFQQMKKQIMDEFLTDSKSFMEDVDDNLFKNFGVGADLSANQFKSKWQDDGTGRSFLITPEKNAELKIVVSDGFITIDATEKSHHGVSTSKVSLNVPEELDWKKHTITKKGNDIVVKFPYYKGISSEPVNYKMEPPVNNLKKSKPATDDEVDTMPIVPGSKYDVI